MGLCIFCGQAGRMTREHLFGKWLKALVRRRLRHADQTLEQRREGGQMPAQRGMTIVNRLGGNIGDRQLKIVCAACNNGWMSRLQAAAKPIVVSIFGGQRHTLTPAEQATLARWAIMMSMVVEYDDPRPQSRSIPQADRAELMAAVRAGRDTNLPEWQVAIGHVFVNDPEELGFAHSGHEFAGGLRAQTSSFRVRELAIFCWSVHNSAGGIPVEDEFLVRNGLLEILPGRGDVEWPPIIKLWPQALDRVHEAMRVGLVAFSEAPSTA